MTRFINPHTFKSFQSSIYQKIILIFTAVLLLIGGFCTGIYIQGLTLIKEEITQVMKEQNISLAKKLQDECRQIRMMKYQLVDSEDVIDILIGFVHNDDDKLRADVHRIQDSLSTIWQGNSLIKEVTVIVPYAGLVINTGTSYAMDAYWATLIEDNKEIPPGTLTEYRDKLLLVTDYLDTEYYVCVELDRRSVNTYLGQMNGEKAGMSILYNIRSKGFLGKTIDDAAKTVLERNIVNVKADEVTEKDGYLFCISEISNTEYFCITFAENQSIYGKLNQYRNFYIILLFVIFFSGIWFWRKMLGMIRRPMQVLVHSLDEITGGNLDERISYHRSDEFQYIYNSFNNMASKLKNLIDKNYKQEILLQKAELKQLQSQISPHFFYNSFITLSNRINAEDYEFAAEFSRLLGQYFMFVTRNGREYVTLKEELEHACTYVNIQNIRFRNRVSVQLDSLKPEYEVIKIPRLIVQPVFENVFKYVVGKTREEVFLHMGISTEGELLKITIENSGRINKEEIETMERRLNASEGEIHGMANIHQRLKLVYHNRGGLSLSKSVYGGLKVTIHILLHIPGEV